MATQWTAMTRMHPHEWLLSNGEVVREPALEMTSTGRKVRVAGTTESVFASDLDRLLTRSVQQVAKEKSAKVWLNLTGGLDHKMQSSIGFNPHQTKAQLHVIDPNPSGPTLVWWRFKDSTTPFEVYLVARMTTRSGSSVPQVINFHLYMPTTNHHYYSDLDSETQVIGVSSTSFYEVTDRLSDDDEDAWVEYIRDNPFNDDLMERLGTHSHGNPRTAVKHLLEIVRLVEDMETIEVPDFSDPAVQGKRTLEIYQTNINAQLVSDMAEYLDGAPTIERAAGLYEELLQAFRNVGITIGAKAHNDFMTALLQGDRESLSVNVSHLAEEHLQDDRNHKLSMHLPTGTFVVECSHRDVDKNMVAEKWEEAVTMASLTGEEDVLLAYAREYAKSAVEERTKNVLKQRRS